MGILHSLHSYAKWFHRALHVHENAEIYVLNLRHTMFNVHKLTFRYIRILPNFTIQLSISFNIVSKLFGVWVANYDVMDLRKWDKCNCGYFLHTKFVIHVGTLN